MPDTKISDLPAAASAELNAQVAADNANGTQTQRVTLSQIRSLGPASHASTHGSAGADPITPASIGAAAASHADRHYTGGPDQLLPAAIGAADAVHSHSPDAIVGGTSVQYLRGGGPGGGSVWAEPPTVQTVAYTQSTVWNKPTNAKLVGVVVIGGGGGGGGGGSRAAGTAVGGGAGGGGGAVSHWFGIDAARLPQSVSITVAAGGPGGAGAAAVGQNGSAGQQGGWSSFGQFVFADGGAGGGGGSATGGTPLAVSGPRGLDAPATQGAAGGTGAVGANAVSSLSSGAGGGGGGASAANAGFNGGNGAISWGTYGEPVAATSGQNAASHGQTLSPFPGNGGGGGAGRGGTANAGQAGGSGSIFGGGGGGGGAGQGAAGGAGGSGANGIVVVTTYF